jgi:3-oxoacyl-(acyl-carrier-protein) synthase
MGRAAHLAIGAAHMAMADARWNMTEEEKFTCPVFLGTAVGGMDFAEAQFKLLFHEGPLKLSPYGGVACLLCIRFQCHFI